MKTITLTLNEALVLIAEGMTMNNVKSLANKLRNADAPMPAIHPSNAAYEKTRKDNDDLRKECVRHYENLDVAKQNLKLANQQVYDLERALEKAKQTETTLRAEISNLENYVKQDAESLKYFRKWVEELRVATGYDEGVMPATVFSNSIELVRQHNELCKRAADLESKLVKANDVIATVKAAYDVNEFNDDKIMLITSAVEAYYRGN